MNDFSVFDEDTNVFTDLDRVVLNTGGNIYHIVLKIGLYGLVFSVVLCGICFLLYSGDSRQHSELKAWALRISISAVALTGLLTIAGLISTFLSGF